MQSNAYLPAAVSHKFNCLSVLFLQVIESKMTEVVSGRKRQKCEIKMKVVR